MMNKPLLIFSLLTIISLTHSVKYTGIIKLVDLYDWMNYVITNTGYFPEHEVLYYNVEKSKETLQAFFNVTDPATGISTPLPTIQFCKIHDVDSLAPLYNLTTIITSYLLPMGLNCDVAKGKKMMLQSVRSTYYLPMEPTPCDHFNVTTYVTDPTKGAPFPFITMIFTVTKPGIKCDKPAITTPKIPENPDNPPSAKVSGNVSSSGKASGDASVSSGNNSGSTAAKVKRSPI